MRTHPPFRVGQPVRLATYTPPGHVRTPSYLRGQIGIIERDLGETGDPEALAYGQKPVPRRRLYRVRFQMGSVWGDAAEQPDDRLDAEIFDNWLEPVDAP